MVSVVLDNIIVFTDIGVFLEMAEIQDIMDILLNHSIDWLIDWLTSQAIKCNVGDGCSPTPMVTEVFQIFKTLHRETFGIF